MPSNVSLRRHVEAHNGYRWRLPLLLMQAVETVYYTCYYFTPFAF